MEISNPERSKGWCCSGHTTAMKFEDHQIQKLTKEDESDTYLAIHSGDSQLAVLQSFTPKFYGSELDEDAQDITGQLDRTTPDYVPRPQYTIRLENLLTGRPSGSMMDLKIGKTVTSEMRRKYHKEALDAKIAKELRST